MLVFSISISTNMAVRRNCEVGLFAEGLELLKKDRSLGNMQFLLTSFRNMININMVTAQTVLIW
jgi:hypothetical protein